MITGRNKWALGGGLVLALGLGSVTVMASNVAKNAPGKAAHTFGQKVAASARLEGDKAVQFMKVWDTATEKRQQDRRELVAAMKQLSEEVKAGKKDKELTRALDRVQGAFLSLADGTGKTIDSLRATMTPNEQARILLASKAHKILSLPGMKQAIPALIGHIRTEFLNSVPNLDPEAKKKLEEIAQAQTRERAKLLEQRHEAIQKLQALGSESKDVGPLVEQIATNGAAMLETISEQFTQVRKNVPETELARVLLALGERVRGLRGKLRNWHKEAAQD